MSDIIEISGVRLKIGSFDLELTIKDAKKLQELLNEVFSGRAVYHPYHSYLWPPTWRRWNDWVITYGDNTADSITISDDNANSARVMTFSYSEDV